jgi:PEP-CTERM motif
MKCLSYIAMTLVAVLSVTASQASANLLANPGFESPITMDGPPFVGSWEGFQGGGASAANGSSMPRSGAMEVDLGLTTINTFAGVFQDVPVTALSPVTFSGWHKAGTSPLNLGTEIRIEWRNSVSDTEVSRTANLTPVATADYTQFVLATSAPATANIARVVYAIQSFSTAPLGNGGVFIDDFSVTVPEPSTSTLALAGIASIAGILVYRRRAQ